MRDNIKLLDCTLRDGGYITDWYFGEDIIKRMICDLAAAGLDFVECGYLNRRPYEKGTAIFHCIDQVKGFLPKNKSAAKMLVMADVTQFLPEDITPYDGTSVDGIRVVFYKHQIEEALVLCEKVKDMGYELFVQPMVTIDYSLAEYQSLSRKISELEPCGVAIVDSFGYMLKENFRQYFDILDAVLKPDVFIGFHSHNNMQLAFVTAQDILEYETNRNLIIDCSLYGIGRGAGNLNTELIANYYNMTKHRKYNIEKIEECISKYIMPIAAEKSWGYSPYMFLTGRYHCHPNFACYLLEKHPLSVSEFREYLQMIPVEMRTRCKRPYVEQLFQQYSREKQSK